MRLNNLRATVLFPVTIAIFVVGLIGFGGCASGVGVLSTTPGFEDIPEFEELEPLPIEVTIDQLYQEYMADEEAANTKYEGKRLLFTNILVEEINSHNVDPSAAVPNIYIVNSYVEFRPKYWIDVAHVAKGFIVDIVGRPRGIFGVEQPYLIVDDARIFIVEGDSGATAPKSDY